MKRSIPLLSVVLAVVGLVWVLGNNGDAQKYTYEEQRTVELLNGWRIVAGLPPVNENPKLTGAAQQHAQYLAEQGICSHNSADGSLPDVRIKQTGYVPATWGEVITCGHQTIHEGVEKWWLSPAHKAIMLDKRFDEIGCGWGKSKENVNYVVCDLGKAK